MPARNSSSLFKALSCREIVSSKVFRSPCCIDLVSDESIPGSGAVHLGNGGPPLAIAFNKEKANGQLLAVADEDGYIRIFNTEQELPLTSDHEDSQSWLAHQNSVFDVCWSQGDTQILTASGDQTVKIWDTERQEELLLLNWHSGSVKCLSLHPLHSTIFASGSRDGRIAIWDTRTNNSSNNSSYTPVAFINDAHKINRPRQKTCTQSVTSVIYIGDEWHLASAGAVDGVIKFWDTRNLKKQVAQTQMETDVDRCSRVHGYTSLSKDLFGTRIIASCTDNRIYMYSTREPEKGAIRSFSGHSSSSFYVKAAFSPDGTHIASGCCESDAYVWQVDKPDKPVRLKGHSCEVTAIDWCTSQNCKLATCSDDQTVRVWMTRQCVTGEKEKEKEKEKKKNGDESPVSVLNSDCVAIRCPKRQRSIQHYFM